MRVFAKACYPFVAVRRLLILAIALLTFVGVVTASAKTVQERRAERLLRLQKISSASSASFASSASSNTSTINKQTSRFAIPLLVYHHIRPTTGYDKATWSWKMSVSPKVFDVQMQWLDDHQYTPITLDTFVKIARREMQGPVKPIVITFDDSHSSQYDVAFPVLKKHGFTTVFYVITKTLDVAGALSRVQVQEMSAAGMDMESHTAKHQVLTKLPQNEMDWELAESKRVLEGLTGKPVRHIAYPATTQNALVRERTSAAGYVTGTLMDPRRATEKDDLLRIPRIMMTDDTDLKKILP